MSHVPPTTFDEIVASHQHEVLRLCRSIVRDEHLGADAAQETFLRLWRRITAGQRPEHAGAWLRRVAVTTAIDAARKRSGRPTATDADVERIASDAPSPSDRELLQLFETALAELPEGQRTVFLLRHEGQMPLTDVARVLDVSLATVKTQFARAALRLQTKLAPYRPENDS